MLYCTVSPKVSIGRFKKMKENVIDQKNNTFLNN